MESRKLTIWELARLCVELQKGRSGECMRVMVGQHHYEFLRS
jgi:hypothetical protein